VTRSPNKDRGQFLAEVGQLSGAASALVDGHAMGEVETPAGARPTSLPRTHHCEADLANAWCAR
jgi:hypothetical protein